MSKHALICDPTEGKTRQSHKDECDVNQILKKYQAGVPITHLSKTQGQYGYATSQSFHDAMNIVASATEEFMQQSSSIRAEFDNDPAKFLDALQDPANRESMIEMGLIDPQDKTPDKATQEASTEPEKVEKEKSE